MTDVMPDPSPLVEDEENCILGICCDPVRRRRTLAKKIHRECHLKEADATTVANAIIDWYDLALKGDLMQLYVNVAAMAREYPYQG